MTPPTLPGEVWRGDIDGPVCVTMTDGRPVVWMWHDSQQWVMWAGATDVLAAWALSLRADAQRAAEDMRERAAQEIRRYASDRREASHVSEDAVGNLITAIRALPIEPGKAEP